MNVALIQRALENLLRNAIRRTPRGGRVTLSVSRTPTAATVCVADTGSGIRPEELPRVFDRAFRGADASREDRAGAGLGLAIVKRIIELRGGRISADSAPGADRVVIRATLRSQSLQLFFIALRGHVVQFENDLRERLYRPGRLVALYHSFKLRLVGGSHRMLHVH